MIGAGPSGLVTVKTLHEKGITPTCFEMGEHVGGVWVFNNSNGRGGAYRSLHSNTSTTQMQFSDFPMPEGIGDFPHHPHIAKYFEDYAAEFELKKHIRFNREVVHCRPTAHGYEVETRDRQSGETVKESFDGVVVANGHHFSPSFPSPLPSQGFTGLVTHSHDYIDRTEPNDFTDKDVIVVGMGNSAMDIACELARPGGARSVTVSARRGAWVMPKYLRGKPIDGPRSSLCGFLRASGADW